MPCADSPRARSFGLADDAKASVGGDGAHQVAHLYPGFRIAQLARHQLRQAVRLDLRHQQLPRFHPERIGYAVECAEVWQHAPLRIFDSVP